MIIFFSTLDMRQLWRSRPSSEIRAFIPDSARKPLRIFAGTVWLAEAVPVSSAPAGAFWVFCDGKQRHSPVKHMASEELGWIDTEAELDVCPGFADRLIWRSQLQWLEDLPTIGGLVKLNLI
ncbi:hypothetical protein [Rhizobium hidalgonense]|uniref:hypothetical protein n=1 Tax=Rhizobium hidalgonense TaxID=1538159 RepID=UPI0028712794|nr:hypothetical protein [Rhizobium hidalgonense]MDR9813235.1 hypothetical protein [Rhizobium hidalgonense]